MAAMTSGTLAGEGGATLYFEQWAATPPARARVVVVHGLAEHVGRYRHVIEALTAHGYEVVAADHHGHGQSAGKRGTMREFDRYIRDLDVVIDHAQAEGPTLPLVLLGHSMGGLIAVRYALAHEPAVAALVLSGAALLVGDDVSPLLKRISGPLARLLPDLPAQPLGKDIRSRDPAVQAAFEADPLAYNGWVRAAMGDQLLRASADTRRRMRQLSLPMLIMHGAADRLVDPRGSQLLYDEAVSTDKTLKMWEDNYHEIFNEYDQETVLATMIHWLNERFPAG